MASPDPWAHPNARRLIGLFRAAVLDEHGLYDGVVEDAVAAKRLERLLERVRKVGARGRRLVLKEGPGDPAVAAIVREMKATMDEALQILEEES